MISKIATRERNAIAEAAHRISTAADYERLVDQAATARIVLIGEASHGTHEFYAIRAEITRRLIEQHGFRILGLEADWPDTLRMHRFITERSQDRNAIEALGDFRRFPAWMWRNTVVVEFLASLRDWNDRRGSSPDKAGIFGLDLYSLHTSMDAVVSYLEKVDPVAAERARRRYGCFEFFGGDPQAYGYATTRGSAESCEEDVVAQLVDLRRRYGELMSRDGKIAEDEFFYAEQNARLVANAERYYRAMFRGRDASWNLRDQHMMETLAALLAHYGRGSKAIVWAHNSHLGDARATEMSERGEWNLGQLARERFDTEVFSIGFSTYQGTVTAAREWGGSAERRSVRPGLPGSYEELLHESDIPAFWLNLGGRNAATKLLQRNRLQRAIGVIYRPETERWSHYFECKLPEQFDAIIHLDETSALEPLERTSQWDAGGAS